MKLQTLPCQRRRILGGHVRPRQFPAQCMLHGSHPYLRAFGVPSQVRGTLIFYSSAHHRGVTPRFRVWAEAGASRVPEEREGCQRKKTDRCPVALHFSRKTPMLCRWPVVRTQPNSKCPATNAGAEHSLRARFFFSLRTRAASRMQTDLKNSPTRSVWRFHVPRIWICSINGGENSVKRKTQNVVDVFVPRLFVVVLFPQKRCCGTTFRRQPSRATLFASNS